MVGFVLSVSQISLVLAWAISVEGGSIFLSIGMNSGFGVIFSRCWVVEVVVVGVEVVEDVVVVFGDFGEVFGGF